MTTQPGNETIMATHLTTTDDTMANHTTGTDFDRRSFLKFTGMAAALAVGAAACVNPKSTEQIAQTGTLVPSPSTSVAPFPGSDLLDATLVLTALSLELLAGEVYAEILDKGWLVSPGTADLTRKVADQHKKHADTLAAQASFLGQDAKAVKANDAVRKALVADQLDGIAGVAGDKRKAENLALKLALSLEDAGQQIYTRAGGTMTTSELRQNISAVGASTARQYAAVASVSGDVTTPFSFGHTAPAAVPSDNYVQADPAKVKKAAAAPGSTARPASGTATTVGTTPGSPTTTSGA